MANQVLYEGNFAEWQNRMDEVLTKASLPSLTNWLADETLLASQDADLVKIQRRTLHTLEMQISPRLLIRIPPAARLRLATWLRTLPKYAQPFRLLDLSAELRLQIYEEAFSNSWGYPRYGHNGRVHGPKADLLRLSKQIREEALPLFYSMFVIGPSCTESKAYVICAKACVVVNAQKGLHRAVCAVHIEVRAKGGLNISTKPRVHTEETRVDEFIAKVGRTSDGREMQGEAVFAVLEMGAELCVGKLKLAES